MKAIILAGGKGTRLIDPANPAPKVLREANGKPLIQYVLNALDHIEKQDITIIVGFMREMVMERYPEYPFTVQEQQLGTGHAVMCAIEASDLESYDGDVAILCGDAPMINKNTILELERVHRESGNTCTILSCLSYEDDAYGRIIRKDGKVAGIVEAKDCTPEERAVPEKNTGLYIFDCKSLCETIKMVGNNNKQGEYYLTDVPKLLIEQGKKVDAYITDDKTQLMGVNTVEDLAVVENILKEMEA